MQASFLKGSSKVAAEPVLPREIGEEEKERKVCVGPEWLELVMLLSPGIPGIPGSSLYQRPGAPRVIYTRWYVPSCVSKRSFWFQNLHLDNSFYITLKKADIFRARECDAGADPSIPSVRESKGSYVASWCSLRGPMRHFCFRVLCILSTAAGILDSRIGGAFGRRSGTD